MARVVVRQHGLVLGALIAACSAVWLAGYWLIYGFVMLWWYLLKWTVLATVFVYGWAAALLWHGGRAGYRTWRNRDVNSR